MLESRKNLT